MPPYRLVIDLTDLPSDVASERLAELTTVSSFVDESARFPDLGEQQHLLVAPDVDTRDPHRVYRARRLLSDVLGADWRVRGEDLPTISQGISGNVMLLAGSDIGTGPIDVVLKGQDDDDRLPPPPPPAGVAPSPGTSPTLQPGTAIPVPSPAPTPPPGCDPCQAIPAGLAALSDMPRLWRHLDDPTRTRLAETVLESLYKERVEYAHGAAWVVSPEQMLLGLVRGADRAGLAEEMLRARAKLAKADQDLAEARADIEKGRAKTVGSVADYAGELLHHAQKWRALAGWGVGVLIATLLFAMVAVGYILTYLLPKGKVSGEAAALVVFTLAVFAASPAVLLLRERPLKGIDEWMPGGVAGEGADKAEQPAKKDAGTATAK